jgi:hypothetical protein
MNRKKLALRMDELNRRRFVTGVAHTALGVTFLNHLPGMAADVRGAGPQKATAKNVIFLYMGGGMSHMDTLDPKGHPDSKGPTDPIPTNVPGIYIGNHLPLLARHMDKMAIIRSMAQQTGDHEGATYTMHTSFRMQPGVNYPQLGPWSQYFLGRPSPYIPASVAVAAGNPGPGFFPPDHSPLPIGNPSSGIKDLVPKDKGRFESRMELAKEFASQFSKEFPNERVGAYSDFYDETIKLFSDKTIDLFDISKEPQAIRARYGNSRFGQGCLLARRLVESGEVRFVEVGGLGGWDMHDNVDGPIQRNSATLDQGMATLLEDLSERGLLESTMVVLCSEFGRTPINQRGGRDHNPGAFSTVLAGGGITGGAVHGKSDDRGRRVEEDLVEVKDFHATIGYALGLPLEQRVHPAGGRPLFVADRGKVLTHLFS